jgi:hypothetical protein
MPPWIDGNCGEPKRERRFAEPIWARVEQLRLEDQQRLEEELLEQQRQDAEYMALFGDTYPGQTYRDLYAEIESSAIAALVERGDKRPLANLLDPRYPFNAYGPPERQIRATLSEQTYLFAAKVIANEFKHPGGRPKKGTEKNPDTPCAKVRRATDAAAKSLPFLRAALRAAYSNEKPRLTRSDISKRALYMASKKYLVAEGTITNCSRLPKSRRLPD